MGECGKDGDYFAWGNMAWTLTGSAELEVWQKEDICSEPAIHIFNTKFPSWDSCVQHCQKINSRIPSVATLDEWKILHRFFEDNVYNKSLDIEELWLSVSDEEDEGEWADYSTHKRMVHPGNFEVGQPNGGEVQNHVLLLPSEMQKVADPADISVLFFSAGANFWAILGHFWPFQQFWVIFCGKICICAI